MVDVLVQFAKRILAPVAALLAVLIGLGLAVVHARGFLAPEDDINRSLAAAREPDANTISGIFSNLGSTSVVIAITALVAITLRLVLKRWREPLFLCAAVSAQALVFLLTTLAIDRSRPDVAHMDVSPPTSSFPSGHTSAATALWGGLALLLAGLSRRTWQKYLSWSLLLVPLGVALARLYRGMHHPTDVLASFLNGATCLRIMSRSILDRTVTWTRHKLTPATARA